LDEDVDRLEVAMDHSSDGVEIFQASSELSNEIEAHLEAARDRSRGHLGHIMAEVALGAVF